MSAMTTPTFARRALLLPVLVPLAALPFAFTAVGPAVQLTVLFLIGSLVWGGLPYACFVIVLLRKMARTESGRLIALAWRSPVRFAWMQGGFVALCLTGERLFGDCDACTPWWTIGGLSATFAIVGGALGYAYVALTAALHAALRGVGVVRDEVDRRSPAAE